MTLDELETLIHGEGEIEASTLTNAKQWIRNKLDGETRRAIVKRGDWVFSLTIEELEKMSNDEVKEWMEDTLHEDQSYVFDALRLLVEKYNMPHHLITVTVYGEE